MPRRLTARGRTLATLRLLTRQSSFPVAGRQTSGLPAKTRSERRIRNHHLRVTLASETSDTKTFRPVARDGAFRGLLAVSFSGRLTKWRQPTTQPATSTRRERDKRPSRRAIDSIPLTIPFPEAHLCPVSLLFVMPECEAVFNRRLCAILGK